MKQHITNEQLKELNKQSKRKLEDGVIGGALAWGSQLSIGKMIEILENEYDLVITHGSLWWVGDIKKTWSVNEENLVDALWEAVKEVI